VREGRRNDVYLDSRGIPTVGIGHKVLPEDNLKVGDVISDAQVEAFYVKDSKVVLNGTCQRLWYSRVWNLGLVELRWLSGIRLSKAASGLLCDPGE
jgi:GH24 family phage-related lysozyme (muramidase)